MKQLQRFLGLTGYFRKFIGGYATISKPLTKLLQKEVEYVFGEEQRSSFNTLKRVLVTDPVLKIYDEKAETELHTDASKDGYGAVLMQKDECDKFHPVAYMSQQTSSAERNYSAYHLEVLAVVRAVEKFRVYLLGIKFKIITDCAAFKHTLKAKELSTRIARWALMLEEYEYEVIHRSGTVMKHVDTLSRAPIMIVTSDPMIEALRRSQRSDERVKAIVELLKVQPFEDYFLSDDLLMTVIKGREVIVVPAAMQSELIRTVHENGHLGARKLEEIIQQEFYIPNLIELVKRTIECCVECILAERKRGKTEGLLNPIVKGDTPLDTYHLDHLGPMDTTEKKYRYVFVVVDAFSKYTWIYPTKTTNSFEVIQRLSAQSECFGNPRRIVSDKGAAFTSNDFKQYCKGKNIERVEISTGVPRGNGQVERVNQVIMGMLRKLCVNDPTKWYKHVANIQRWINSSPHQSIGITPFEAMFGVPMRHEEDLRLGELVEQIKVAIKRTQFGPGRKYAAEFLGPYNVTGVRPYDRYDVVKVDGEGPNVTSTAASHMKPYRV